MKYWSNVSFHFTDCIHAWKWNLDSWVSHSQQEQTCAAAVRTPNMHFIVTCEQDASLCCLVHHHGNQWQEQIIFAVFSPMIDTLSRQVSHTQLRRQKLRKICSISSTIMAVVNGDPNGATSQQSRTNRQTRVYRNEVFWNTTPISVHSYRQIQSIALTLSSRWINHLLTSPWLLHKRVSWWFTLKDQIHCMTQKFAELHLNRLKRGTN